MKILARSSVCVGALGVLTACGASLGPSRGSDAPPMEAAAPIQSRIPATSSSYRVVYRFVGRSDGAAPESGLIDVDGKLYGTTVYGGNTTCRDDGEAGCGSVYSVTRKGAENLFFTFTRQYGANPRSPVIRAKGTLYGTAYDGGWSQRGTVYSISPTGSVTTLHTFSGRGGPSKDGIYPSRGKLISLDGTLYGTTGAGGSSADGTFYSISTSGSERVLYSFAGGSDGAAPIGGLINVNGTFYGTTVRGGTGCETVSGSYSGCGAVYSITTSGVEKVLYRFQGDADGANPSADLLYVDGTFYGVTSSGGASQRGTVFSVTAKGKEKVLYSFAGGSDGAVPLSPLIEVNGTLYGTTSEGGGTGCKGNGCGTVYGISTRGSERVLHSFSGYNGFDPEGALLDVKGTLYGTTLYGGILGKEDAKCCGTVFAIKP